MDGVYLPLGEARLPVTDWGLIRSDATYDVVHVWQGAFFRLGEHIERFRASAARLRLDVPDAATLRDIVHGCVARSGLTESYVALVATRGAPVGPSRMPGACRNRVLAYARPWVWVFSPDVIARGAWLVIPETVRIPTNAVDPRVKNYHWGDFTYGLFEAEDRGADSALLLDAAGFVTEGAGFNVFIVKDRTVVFPDQGALEGVTRRTVMELCPQLGLSLEVRPITRAELEQADEVCACTTAGGIMPVARVDDRIYGNGGPGPISLAIKDAYWALHADPAHRDPVDYSAA